MAANASHALGAPETAGTFVSPKGLTRKMTASVTGSVVGGVLGRAAATAVTGPVHQGAPGMPQFGRIGYVAVSPSEVALVKTKTGLFSTKITAEVFARAPKTEVAAAELDQGRMLSQLKITFSNGVLWEFEIPLVYKKTARKVVEALGGTVR